MDADEVVKGRWYPNQPPKLPGENGDQYTDRLTGADRTNRRPYDHHRNRQCSIGWHEECSDRAGYGNGECECPHHEVMREAHELAAQWNRLHPVGTRVTMPDAPSEPETVTTSPAHVEYRATWIRWPVVNLQGFDHPVELTWCSAVQEVPAEVSDEGR